MSILGLQALASAAEGSLAVQLRVVEGMELSSGRIKISLLHQNTLVRALPLAKLGSRVQGELCADHDTTLTTTPPQEPAAGKKQHPWRGASTNGAHAQTRAGHAILICSQVV